MIRVSIVAAFVVCAVLPCATFAQSAPTTGQLPSRLLPATRNAIERLADSLKSSGVPSDPLFDKAAEGVLKNADDARILAAVRSLARELGTASSLLGTSAPVTDVVSAASALRAGVSVQAVQKLAARRSKTGDTDGRLSLSFIILADFASRGVPVDAAVNAVDGLLARGAGGNELTAFRVGVERDLLAGRDALSTLTTRADGVLRRR